MKVFHDFPEFWFNLASSHPTQYKTNPESKKNLSSQACVTLQLRIPGNFKSSCIVFLGLLVGLGETVQKVVAATTLATKLEKQEKLILFSRHHHLKFKGPSFLLSSPDRTSFFKPSFPSSFRQVDLEAIDIFGYFSTQWSGWRKQTQMIPSKPA